MTCSNELKHPEWPWNKRTIRSVCISRSYFENDSFRCSHLTHVRTCLAGNDKALSLWYSFKWRVSGCKSVFLGNSTGASGSVSNLLLGSTNGSSGEVWIVKQGFSFVLHWRSFSRLCRLLLLLLLLCSICIYSIWIHRWTLFYSTSASYPNPTLQYPGL